MRASKPFSGSTFTKFPAFPSRLKRPPLRSLRRRPYLRCYHSTATPSPRAPYAATETRILDAATKHIPNCGFTRDALIKGAEDVGYLSVSLALFPRGAYELVMYHLITQRLHLRDSLPWMTNSHHAHDERTSSVGSKVRLAVLARLRANVAIAHRYSEAIALMSLASNIPPSLVELGQLSDEIWWLAGDRSVDPSWYTKRGLLSAVYAATETFMTQDRSTDFKDTEKFLDRRLEDVKILGQGVSDVGQFVGYAGISTINVLRSWGVRV